MGNEMLHELSGGTSLNLGIGQVYHPRMGVDGGAKELSDFKADEY